MSRFNVSKDDTEWLNDWWVNPVQDGSPEPDPQDLQQTQAYIQQNYTPEIQELIKIQVRPIKQVD
ncbi:hypothetical protein PQG02_06855 [Nostoc sp. UHCC 0926]|uniref:hypothetical protein n=1 Tax=unclassified Nostoc TaxID=2593658 RepID=UPI0023631230|nr:hypothetical protein [Nostoc sp. UHCC 0926]WDD34060.1 hypothetical protein PQG02_06855 [Nostoc sp. UHCC 0926]